MSKAEELFELSFYMQGSAEGRSLDDIQQKFDVSRRTAERMRERLLRLFPQAEEVQTGGRVKRWRLPVATNRVLLSFSAEELASLEAAISVMNRDNLREQSQHIDRVKEKIRSFMKPEVVRRVEPDLEALLESEGLGHRAGPGSAVNLGIVSTLREAIIVWQKVEMRFLQRTTRHHPGDTHREVDQQVSPLGFVYGNRQYLVAGLGDDWTNTGKVHLFEVSQIVAVQMTESTFNRGDFSLNDYVSESFGVHRDGGVMDVTLLFSNRMALDARAFEFHASQSFEEGPDGTLIVHFKCSGVKELLWHLFTWGADVEIVSPGLLKDRYLQTLESVARPLRENIRNEWHSKPALDLELEAEEIPVLQSMIYAVLENSEEEEFIGFTDAVEHELREIAAMNAFNKIPAGYTFAFEALWNVYDDRNNYENWSGTAHEIAVLGKIEVSIEFGRKQHLIREIMNEI
jgi:predicted DNA-binding transcriptional regulator YafY